MDLASVIEDRLSTALRRVDAALESSLGKAIDGLVGAEMDAAKAAEMKSAAQKVIQEVWEIIDENYVDARGAGFDRARWKSLRDEAFDEVSDLSGAHRAARRMIAYGLLSDPYTRFISPSEFTAMLKYDITGVGLNLVTGEEFSKKVNQPLPEGRSSSGVFVLGVIKSSSADQGGISEGDEIIRVDGKLVDKRTPFQTASLIQGVDEDDQEPSSSSAPPPKNLVVVEIRKPSGLLKEIELTRPEKPASKSPVSYRLERGFERTGFIQLTSFNAQAQRKVKEAVIALEKEGEFSALAYLFWLLFVSNKVQ